MKKYQYEVVPIGNLEFKLIGPLVGIKEVRGSKEEDPYIYCQVLDGAAVQAFCAHEIFNTDELIGETNG
jgi:hypothetical protein